MVTGASRSTRPVTLRGAVGRDQPARGPRRRSTRWTGSGRTVDPGQAAAERAAAGPARGARARALHLPLPARRRAGRDLAAAAAADRGADRGRTPTGGDRSPSGRGRRQGAGRPARRRTIIAAQARDRERQQGAPRTPSRARTRRAIFYRPGDLRQQLQTPLASPRWRERDRASRTTITARLSWTTVNDARRSATVFDCVAAPDPARVDPDARHAVAPRAPVGVRGFTSGGDPASPAPRDGGSRGA